MRQCAPERELGAIRIVRTVSVRRRVRRASCLAAALVMALVAPALAREAAPMQTFVSSQSAEGLRELTLPFVEAVGRYRAQRWQARTRDVLAARGAPAPVPLPEMGATLIERRGQVFGVVRLRNLDWRMVFVLALRDGQLVSVGCVQQTPTPIALTFGPCGEKIEQTFGAALAGR
jgi:hypothetical protein